MQRWQSTNNNTNNGRLRAVRSFTSFEIVEMNYLGPIALKICYRDKSEVVDCFKCLQVRRVHMKMIPNLDTDICLNAVTLFDARRGKLSTIISDNVTKIVEAE